MICIYRHIIAMKSEGYVETPQDILEVYNGCSVAQYTCYGLLRPAAPRSGNDGQVLHWRRNAQVLGEEHRGFGKGDGRDLGAHQRHAAGA